LVPEQACTEVEQPTQTAHDRGALLLVITADATVRATVAAVLDGRGLRYIALAVDDRAVMRLQLPDLDRDATDALRAELCALLAGKPADLCLLQAAEWAPRRRLCAFDMDSTLIDCEVIDELAALAGVGAEVAAITARAMRGEIDFRASFRERMAKLRGLSAHCLDDVAANLPLMPGARRLLQRLRALGHETVILSGGFDYFARQLQERLGIDEVHANRLQLVDGSLSGDVEGEIVDAARKVALLREVAARRGFALQDTLAVGDGANDLPMLAEAGLGIAFHAKPLVRERAPHAISHASLDSLLYLLEFP
jgi:phosphoserine phosphatase